MVFYGFLWFFMVFSSGKTRNLKTEHVWKDACRNVPEFHLESINVPSETVCPEKGADAGVGVGMLRGGRIPLNEKSKFQSL